VKVDDNLVMRTTPRLHCYLCGDAGQTIHEGLKDRLYDVPGVWSSRQCLNQNCRLVWLDPMPFEEDIGKAYKNYYTHEGDLSSVRYRFRQRIKRGIAGLLYGYRKQTTLTERLLSFPLLFTPFLRDQIIGGTCLFLRGEQLGKVLEIGCGSGILLNNLRALGWDVEGVDFDANVAPIARKNFNIEVQTGSPIERNYPDNCFDAIIMSHVIEHIHDPLAVLATCRRILKPGGKLILLTPNIESLGYQTFRAAWMPLEPPRHLYLFSAATIRTLIERSGLQILDLKTTARFANAWFFLSCKIKQDGRCELSATPDVSNKIRAKLFQIKEQLSLYKKNMTGEELILIATKEQVNVI
jgi:2-polyprenyl-3-methyl-5-hydroxy-6-metoxy-1,4-benzoquinol methylase